MHYYFYHFRLQNSFYIWLLIAGGLYLLKSLRKYIFGPFRIRQTSRHPGLVSYRNCEVEELPAHVAPYFLQMVPPLAAAGFVTLGCATRVNPENNQESYVSLWINRKQMDTAQIITVIGLRRKTGTKVVNMVAYRTEFTDDSAIVTANSPSTGVFPRDPATFAITVPAISDIGELYRLHRARMQRHRGARTATLANFKDASTRIQYEHTRMYERMTKIGYHTYDAASDEYVPTIRGAFLMTYRLLTPFKQIQKWRKARLASEEMRLVDFRLAMPGQSTM